MDDLNSRLGEYVCELSACSEILNTVAYMCLIILDDMNTPNDNVLSAMCINKKLLELNNLKTPTCYFKSEMTYLRGLVSNWICVYVQCHVNL